MANAKAAAGSAVNGFTFKGLNFRIGTLEAQGASGQVNATADSAVTGAAALVTGVEASDSAAVNGSATAAAYADFRNLPGFQSTDAAVAYGFGTPTTSSTSPIFAANPHIAAAFGTSPDVYALGEVGGGHASAGTDAENSSSIVTVDVDAANLAGNEELTFGFYDGQLCDAASVTGVTLDVTGGGKQLIDHTFASANGALAYFTDIGVGRLLLLTSSVERRR